MTEFNPYEAPQAELVDRHRLHDLTADTIVVRA